MQTQNNQKNEIGTLSGILIVILMLVFGGIYFFGQRIEKQKEFQALQNQQNSTTTEQINNTATTLDSENPKK